MVWVIFIKKSKPKTRINYCNHISAIKIIRKSSKSSFPGGPLSSAY